MNFFFSRVYTWEVANFFNSKVIFTAYCRRNKIKLILSAVCTLMEKIFWSNSFLLLKRSRLYAATHTTLSSLVVDWTSHLEAAFHDQKKIIYMLGKSLLSTVLFLFDCFDMPVALLRTKSSATRRRKALKGKIWSRTRSTITWLSP